MQSSSEAVEACCSGPGNRDNERAPTRVIGCRSVGRACWLSPLKLRRGAAFWSRLMLRAQAPKLYWLLSSPRSLRVADRLYDQP